MSTIIKYSLAILLALLALAYFLNPGIEKHKEEIKTIVKSSLLESLEKQGISKDNALLKSINTEAYEDMLWSVVDNNIEYKDYHIISITQVNYLGKTYPISIGFYNVVMIMPQLENQIQNTLDGYIKDNGGLKNLLGF